MATAAFLNQAYLSYFGRPVDSTAVTAWATATNAQVETAFYASAESQALYGTVIDANFINNIYLNILGRAAEPAGITYWLGQIARGLSPATAAITILNGAQGTDITVVNNKLAAAAAFTTGLDTTAEMIGYNGTAAAASARAFLATVMATPATQAAIDAAIATSTTGGASGTTYTLTEAGGSLTGTAGNDTFYATNTAAAGGAKLDGAVLDGAAGTDTLYFTNSNAAQGAPGAIKNIEKIFVQNTGAGGGLVATNISGATEVWDNGSTVAQTVSNIQNAVTIGLKGTAAGVAVTNTFKDGTYAAGATVNVATSGSVGSATTAATLTLGHAATASTATDGVLNLNAVDGTANVVLDTTTGTDLVASFKTINITGAGNIKLAPSAAGGEFATVTTYNASAATGKVNLTAGAFNATTTAVSVKGGSADDKLVLSAATLGTNLTVDGGAGNDTVVVAGRTTTGAIDTAGTYTSIEKLEVAAITTVTNVVANITLDASAIAGGNAVALNAIGSNMTNGTTATFTVNNLSNNAKVEFKGSIGDTNTGAGDVGAVNTALNLGASAKTATTPALDVTLGTTTAGVTLQSLTVDAALKSLTLTSQGAANTIAQLTNDGITTLTIKGEKDLTLTADLTASANNSNLTTVDLTGQAKGTLTLDVDGSNRKAANNGTTFKMGDGVAKITLDADDAKADTIVFNAATQSTATSMDEVTNFVAANDLIDISALVQGTFAFKGTAAFASSAGNTQVRYVDDGTDTVVYIDLNGDATSDMQILLVGTTLGLTAANFDVVV